MIKGSASSLLEGSAGRRPSFRTRRDNRSPPPTLDEVLACVPWGAQIVPYRSLMVPLQAGEPVILETAALASHVGLQVPSRASIVPAPGELCGAVIYTTIQGRATVTRDGWDCAKLRAHQLTALLVTHGGRIELSSVNREGRVWLWACVAMPSGSTGQ